MQESSFLLDREGAGNDPPTHVNGGVEVPKGSDVKYEVDPETGLIFADRFLYTATHYPFNYGFIPRTKGEDGDYPDALVVTEEAAYPMSVVRSRITGALFMEVEGGPDARMLAVPDTDIDPVYSSLSDINELPGFTRKQVECFFTHYKESEPGKFVKVHRWEGRLFAEGLIRRAIAAFEG